MKKTLAIALLSIAVIPMTSANEKDHGHKHDPKHEHTHKEKEAGPNGGRLLTVVEPHAEFFVTKDKKVLITFLDDSGKTIEPSTQIVEVTTGQRSSPTRLSFAKQGSVLLSEQTLPEGDRLPTVVQIRETADSKAAVERFTLDLANCSGCNLAEYACTCAHSH